MVKPPDNDDYIFGVFGGITTLKDGKYASRLVVKVADDKLHVIQRQGSFATAAEAVSDYEVDGHKLFRDRLLVLMRLCGKVMVSTPGKGTLVPLCPLLDGAVVVTSTRVTREEYAKAWDKFVEEHLE